MTGRIPSDKIPTPPSAPKPENTNEGKQPRLNARRFGRTISQQSSDQTHGLKSEQNAGLAQAESNSLKDKQVKPLDSGKLNDKTRTQLDQLRKEVKQLFQNNGLTTELRATLDKQRADLFRQTGVTHYNVLIAGAGPAGLLAAIDQADKGRSVCLCEGRGEGDWDIRSSVMVLHPTTAKRIENILQELTRTHDAGYVFSHKEKSDIDHPKSLTRIHDELKTCAQLGSHPKLQTDVVQRIYKEYAKTRYPELIHIKHEAKAGGIDPWLQTMKLKSSERVAFDSIIHADGVHGSSRQSLQELGINSTRIQMPTPFSGQCQCAYIHHPSWTLLHTDGNLNYRHQIPMDLLADFKKLGWDSDNFPETYAFLSNSESEKLWVCGQSPDNLKPEQQLVWNALVCKAMTSPEDRDVLEAPSYIKTNNQSGRGTKKEKLSHMIFTLEKSKLAEPSTTLPFGKSEAIGDARETPNFFLAEGLHKASQDVARLKMPPPYRDEA